MVMARAIRWHFPHSKPLTPNPETISDLYRITAIDADPKSRKYITLRGIGHYVLPQYILSSVRRVNEWRRKDSDSITT